MKESKGNKRIKVLWDIKQPVTLPFTNLSERVRVGNKASNSLVYQKCWLLYNNKKNR